MALIEGHEPEISCSAEPLSVGEPDPSGARSTLRILTGFLALPSIFY